MDNHEGVTVKALLDSGTERCKKRFSCYKQKVKGSGTSPQLRAKGLKGRMTERDDKND